MPIEIGRKKSVKVYGLFLTGAYLSIIMGYLSGHLPFEALLGIISIVIAIPTLRGVARYADDIPKLLPYMGRNVVINILTPVLLAISLFMGR